MHFGGSGLRILAVNRSASPSLQFATQEIVQRACPLTVDSAHLTPLPADGHATFG